MRFKNWVRLPLAASGFVDVHSVERFSALAFVERNDSNLVRKSSSTASAAVFAEVGKSIVYNVLGYSL